MRTSAKGPADMPSRRHSMGAASLSLGVEVTARLSSLRFIGFMGTENWKHSGPTSATPAWDRPVTGFNRARGSLPDKRT